MDQDQYFPCRHSSNSFEPISMIGNLLENAPLYLQFFFVHKGSVLTTKLLLMYWIEHYV